MLETLGVIPKFFIGAAFMFVFGGAFVGVSLILHKTAKVSFDAVKFSVETTWNGAKVDHPPINMSMQWKSADDASGIRRRMVHIEFEAPFFNDTLPPCDANTHCPGLWDYEVVEVFFANEKDEYTEIEIGPRGNWLVYLLDGERKIFNYGELLKLSVKNTLNGASWKGIFDIPLAYLPPNVSKLNIYGIHGTGKDRVYEALGPADNTQKSPDFHKLKFFVPVDSTKFIPDPYGKTAYKDPELGNLWESRHK